MDNLPIYDLSDEEIDGEEHSRLPLLIVIALLVLAAFAGVIWLAYNQGVARGRSGAPIVIVAPDGPVRTAPPDADAATTPFTGLKVYGRPETPDAAAQGTALAPAQEAQIAPPPPVAALVPPPSPAEAPPVRLNPETPPVLAAVPAPPPAPARQVAQAAPPPSPGAVAPAAAPAAPGAASSALAGKAVLQIGAYESADIANGAWNSFRTRYAEVAGPLAEDVQKADLGAKGIWYRLRVGPFADKAAAAAACEKLKAAGGTCFVAAP